MSAAYESRPGSAIYRDSLTESTPNRVDAFSSLRHGHNGTPAVADKVAVYPEIFINYLIDNDNLIMVILFKFGASHRLILGLGSSCFR